MSNTESGLHVVLIPGSAQPRRARHNSKRQKSPKLKPLHPRQPSYRTTNETSTLTMQHIETEVARLKQLMEAALSAKQLTKAEEIMDQLLSVLEHYHSILSMKQPYLRAQVVTYLEECDIRLNEMIAEANKCRQQHRFQANALMTQVMKRISGPVDPTKQEEVARLLDQAEDAYRQAGDKRYQCIPVIRHKVEAGVLMVEATQKFDDGDFDGAITIAKQAVDHHHAFRGSPMLQRSQLLLSLSDGTNPWTQLPLHQLDEDGIADVTQHFQSRAKAMVETLSHRAVELGEKSDYDGALLALERCEALAKWMHEPLPMTTMKTKRIISLRKAEREVAVLQSNQSRLTTSDSEFYAQLLQWSSNIRQCRISVDVLCASGAITFVLVIATSDLANCAHSNVIANAIRSLLESCIDQSPTLSMLLPDVRVAISALLALVPYQDHSSSRVVLLRLICKLLDSKQAVHVAIKQCAVLESWSDFRESHIADTAVLTVLMELLHGILAMCYPVFVAPCVEHKVVLPLCSTIARHFKYPEMTMLGLQILQLIFEGKPVQHLLEEDKSRVVSKILKDVMHYHESNNSIVSIGNSLCQTLFN